MGSVTIRTRGGLGSRTARAAVGRVMGAGRTRDRRNRRRPIGRRRGASQLALIAPRTPVADRRRGGSPGLAEALARKRVPLGFLAGIVVLLLAQPTARSISIGLLIACVGEALRVWAAGHLNKS